MITSKLLRTTPLVLFVLPAMLLLHGCQKQPPPAPTSEATPELTSEDPEARSSNQTDDVVLPIAFRTVADADVEIAKLGEEPTSEQLAAVISELDSWFVEPTQQDAFRERLMALLTKLRALVKISVEEHQNAALLASNGADAAQRLDQAAQVLALYPVSNDPVVLSEAKQLSRRQAESAIRLDVLRRQRYNQWAVVEIERAIGNYNENVNRWNPFNKSIERIQPLVNILGPIDPMHLEPAVLDLYNYIISKANEQLSESNRLELAKQLTSPSNIRKIPGDF